MEVNTLDIIKEWRTKIPPKELVKRNLPFANIEEKINKAYTLFGLRRAGKTFMMFQYYMALSREREVAYINMEDERLKLLPQSEVQKTLEDLVKQKVLLLIDEVQSMPHWASWLNRMIEMHGSSIIVSGSSSFLRTQNIPRVLRGRTISKQIFPPSIEEAKRFLQRELSSVDKENLLRWGTMPEVLKVQSEAVRQDLLQEYYRTIIERDIKDVNNLRKIEEFESFLYFIINSPLVSAGKMERVLKSAGKPLSKRTILKYMSFSEDAFIVFFVPIFVRSSRAREQYPKKVYLADNGFLTALLPRVSKGRLLENLVADELTKRGFEPGRTLFYWKSQKDYEVDFVLLEGSHVKQLIQVAYSLDEEKTRKREERALVKASRELGCKDLLVLTWDEEGEVERDGKRIVYKPVWKWLFGFG